MLFEDTCRLMECFMPFDLLVWLPTFALTRAAGKGLDKLSKLAVRDRINEGIRNWAHEVNKKVQPGDLTPEAMFPTVAKGATSDGFPGLARLSQALGEFTVPTEAEWLAGLIETWKAGRHRYQENAQAFFRLDEGSAKSHLTKLAKRLVTICRQDPDIAFNTILAKLEAGGAGAVSELAIAENVISFVEHKRLLYIALTREQPKPCYESASAIRQALTDLQLRVSRDSQVCSCIGDILTACEDFMTELESLNIHNLENSGSLFAPKNKKKFERFNAAIDALRDQCSVPIRKLCTSYSITPTSRIRDLYGI